MIHYVLYHWWLIQATKLFIYSPKVINFFLYSMHSFSYWIYRKQNYSSSHGIFITPPSQYIINMITKYLAENVTDHCQGKVERKTTVAGNWNRWLQRRGLVILNRIPRVGFTQIWPHGDLKGKWKRTGKKHCLRWGCAQCGRSWVIRGGRIERQEITEEVEGYS